MVITQPTVDDFSDTSVMRVIRKIVNYICNDLVNGINNNDIVSGQFSVQGNQLSGTLTKGDGTTIDIPAATLPSGGGGSDNPYPTAISITLIGTTLNFNMTMSNGTPITTSVDLAPILEGYATNTELTEIQEQVNGLAPSVSVNGSVSPPTITVGVNGKTASANLPAGGSEWEELNKNSLPSDFTATDIVAIKLNVNNTFFVSNWDTAPGSVTVNSGGTTGYAIANVTLSSIGQVLSISGSSGCVTIISIGQMYGPNEWNSSDETKTLFSIDKVVFNGAGCSLANISINKSNINNYVFAIYRTKNGF